MIKNKRQTEINRPNHNKYNQYSENKCHNKLQTIKLYLMSRDIKRQIMAMDYIIYILNHSKESLVDADMFLVDDIPGLLCDTMNKHDCKLIRKVFECQILLSKSVRFYKERHAMIVLETTLRTLKILMKDVSQMSVVKCGLKLLSQILPRLHVENISTIAKVLSLIHSIMFTSFLQPLHLKVVSILQYIAKYLVYLSSCHADLLAVYHQALQLLGNITSPSVSVYTTILCDVIRNCLRLFLQITSSENLKNIKPIPISTLNKVKSLMWKNIQDIISPSLIKSDLKKCTVIDLDRILKCLLTALNKLPPTEANNLSHYLATLGYLVALPKLNIRLRNTTLTKHSNALISEILSQLCESTLKIGKFSKKQQFKLCIDKGMQSLPVDTSLWTQSLMDYSSKYAQYTVVMYMYFMLLCYKSQALSHAYRPAICSYLNSLRSSIPLPIIKAVWLIYAITSLSETGRQVSRNDCSEKASKILSVMLQGQKNLKNLYTHHPAILYWLFESRYIDRKMQCSIMKLWFVDDSQESFNAVLNLVMNCHVASLCIFEVLQSCSLNVVNKCIKILTAVISRDKENGSSGLSITIWGSLPQILSRSSFSIKSVPNVNSVLYLASQYIPCHLSTALFIRLAIQVNRLMTKYTGQEESYQMLRFLLSRLGLNMTIVTMLSGDLTILKIFLDNDKLIKVLVDEMFVKFSVVNSHLQFLGVLINYQHQYRVKSNAIINIKKEVFLQLMSSSGSEEIVSTLAIVSAMLDTSRKIKPIVFIAEQGKVDFIELLFYLLQILCLKNTEKVRSSSWKNQYLLLQFCSVNRMTILERHLVTHAFTHITLQHCVLSRSSDFWQFVSLWLDNLCRYSSVALRRKWTYDQALCKNNMCTTVTVISQQLLEVVEQTEMYQDIIIKILLLNISIPQDIVNTLRRKACDFEKISISPE